MSATMERIINKYDADAPTYDQHRCENPKWAGEHAFVERVLKNLPSGSRVLDAPVGTGRFIALYHRLGLQFVGADLSSKMLEQARIKSPLADLRLEDCRVLPSCSAASFDAIVCIRLFNLLTEADCAATLRTFGRVLCPDGVVVVSINTLPHGAADKPRTIQSEAALLKAMDVAELKVLSRYEVSSTGRGVYEVFVLRRTGGEQ